MVMGGALCIVISAQVGHAATNEVVSRLEQARVAMVERVAPSVVCVYDEGERGGGSGVLIDEEGYGLTNFHVVAGMLEHRRGFGGLSDGRLYEMTVLGVDPTGDVAMFRLHGDRPFSYSRLGDSDKVRVGDTAIAMGNPFVLSEDHTPTVTLGIVTGVHRYQWGESGNTLVYSDCIQVDTPINPGNSGGPLYNAAGEVIGINGRISVNTRGRFNVGHGYAITSNQIARFMPAMRAGNTVKHGTMQATVDEMPDGGVAFNLVRPGAAADKAGVRSGDRLLAVEGEPIRTANEFASALGAYPANWPLTVTLKRDDVSLDISVRLDEVPLKTKQGITEDPQQNRQAVEALLRRFQRATIGSDGKRPRRWSWRSQRTVVDKVTGESTEKAEHYECTYESGGPLKLRRTYADGRHGGHIDVDEERVAQYYEGSTESFEPPADEVMILRGMYLLYRRLPGSIDEPPLSQAVHVGGEPGTTKARSRFPAMLDVVALPVSEDLTARCAIDVDSGQLRKIELHDRRADLRCAISLSNFGGVDGVGDWPTVWHVQTPHERYVETQTDWVLTP
jgi:S1-C subfamily serine protease